MEEKSQLEEQLRAVMDKYKYKRRQIRELQEDLQTMGRTMDNLGMISTLLSERPLVVGVKVFPHLHKKRTTPNNIPKPAFEINNIKQFCWPHDQEELFMLGATISWVSAKFAPWYDTFRAH
mgnify:CR=1 FL=1